ncbi:MAG: hypothetical protein K9L79_01440 [Methylobacter tundripaludum]|nr:hypothetical protein [Methylobacter tundripaludum]
MKATKYSVITALVLLMAQTDASAEIFQCKVAGKIQISRHPCSESAEQVTLNIKEKYPSPEVMVVTDRPMVEQKSPFVFDNFKWTVTNVYTFGALGSKAYPKHPKVEAFIIVEIEVQNLANEARYVFNQNTVLLTKGKQFEESGMGVYANDVMGYEAGYSTKIEPGVTQKIYKTFDGTKEAKYDFIIRQSGGEKSVDVNISWVRSR